MPGQAACPCRHQTQAYQPRMRHANRQLALLHQSNAGHRLAHSQQPHQSTAKTHSLLTAHAAASLSELHPSTLPSIQASQQPDSHNLSTLQVVSLLSRALRLPRPQLHKPQQQAQSLVTMDGRSIAPSSQQSADSWRCGQTLH